MTVVSDSGPLIHLAMVGHFFLLKQYFHKLLIVPQVYDEVVIQGEGQPGAPELRQAIEEAWIEVELVTDQAAIQRFITPNVSATDASVIACALVKQAALVLADDTEVRGLAVQEGLAITGTIGLLVRARLDGVISELKPLLDQLVASGFYLDPQGQVYQDALRRVGEIT